MLELIRDYLVHEVTADYWKPIVAFSAAAFGLWLDKRKSADV